MTPPPLPPKAAWVLRMLAKASDTPAHVYGGAEHSALRALVARGLAVRLSRCKYGGTLCKLTAAGREAAAGLAVRAT